MSGSPGETNRTLALLVALLAAALVVVMFLWMRDRESKDVQIELGSRVLEVDEAVEWPDRPARLGLSPVGSFASS